MGQATFLDARSELIFLKDDGSQEPLICEAVKKKKEKKKEEKTADLFSG